MCSHDCNILSGISTCCMLPRGKVNNAVAGNSMQTSVSFRRRSFIQSGVFLPLFVCSVQSFPRFENLCTMRSIFSEITSDRSSKLADVYSTRRMPKALRTEQEILGTIYSECNGCLVRLISSSDCALSERCER